ncbi:MAG: nicotinate-nucleotide--dimethylbenzimidazole phosphoribosyltransferase [Chloroflexi bacterium]|nr:nicotinate-nucleotide--dimethylbenzimidazole phosphoribosyltransferase [Chloroflexota bacterium]
MTVLEARCRQVRALDAGAMAAARARQDSLTKPAGSLGVLERLHVQLAGIRRTVLPSISQATILILAADHGVASEGVSAYPREVTAEMVRNFARGGAAINVLAADTDARLVVADLGVDWQGGEPPAGVVRRSLGLGTCNLGVGPAMTAEQVRAGLLAGINLVDGLVGQGTDVLALGEMGIGNTTASAATIAALTGQPVRTVTGFGTGIDDAAWERKVAVVERALARRPLDATCPLDVLAEVGGFEIAGLAGAIVAAAAAGVPVILDGLILGAAALAAVSLCPRTRSYLIASHRSAEPGHRVALEYLELEPLMDLGLRLGEGSGAALALHLVRLACRLPREMATFAEAGVSQDQPEGAARR